MQILSVAQIHEARKGENEPVIITRRIKRKRRKCNKQKKIRKRRDVESVYEYNPARENYSDPEYIPAGPVERPIYEYRPSETEIEIVKQARPVYSVNSASDGRVLFIRSNTPVMTLEFIFYRIRSGEWCFEDLTFENPRVRFDFFDEARSYYLSEEDQVGIGWMHFHDNEFMFALKVFNDALKEDPNNTDALVGRGIVKHYLGIKGGYEDCVKAVEQDPVLSRFVKRYIPEREYRTCNKGGFKVRMGTIKAALVSSSKDLLDFLLMRDIDRRFRDQVKKNEKLLEDPVRNDMMEPPSNSSFQSQYQRQLQEYHHEINFKQIQSQT